MDFLSTPSAKRLQTHSNCKPNKQNFKLETNNLYFVEIMLELWLSRWSQVFPTHLLWGKSHTHSLMHDSCVMSPTFNMNKTKCTMMFDENACGKTCDKSGIEGNMLCSNARVNHYQVTCSSVCLHGHWGTFKPTQLTLNSVISLVNNWSCQVSGISLPNWPKYLLQVQASNHQMSAAKLG